MLVAAIRLNDPVVVLENELLYGTKGVVDRSYVDNVELARVERSGRDLTIVSYSMGTLKALDAAQKLEKMGHSVEVVNLRSLRPLDTTVLFESMHKTKRLLVVEEG